jgi:uncharacterized protein (DUF608 family)
MFSPIIPYDADASTLPIFFVGVNLSNHGEDEVEASVLFNWENLCGQTNETASAPRASVLSGSVKTEDHSKSGDSVAVSANALRFKTKRPVKRNEDGDYCLAILQKKNMQITSRPWNHKDPREWADFWGQFEEHGDLAGDTHSGREKQSGALCSSFTLAPQKHRLVVFALAWYCPMHVVQGVDEGNSYTNRFKNAVAVVQNGFQHLTYYHQSVKNWQNRLMRSSLPRWFNELLINSVHVLTSNALSAKSGFAALIESPANPVVESLAQRLYHSFGMLLFFPRLEGESLAYSAGRTKIDAPNRLCRNLGESTFNKPDFSGNEFEQVVLGVNVVLSAYRNYLLTGDLPRLQGIFPRLRTIMKTALMHDRDLDGLPDTDENTTLYDGAVVNGMNSHLAGLWIVALRAYIKIARFQKMPDEAEIYHKIFMRAIAAFDAKYWNDNEGYYRLGAVSEQDQIDSTTAEICHPGQLAGQWYADFLGLGTLFPKDRIERALDTIARQWKTGWATSDQEQSGKYANLWPEYSLAHCLCLWIYRGHTDLALNLLSQWVKSGNPFGHAMLADSASTLEARPDARRHIAGLSVWYVLYAIQGFEFDVAARRLSITPHLPSGTHSMDTPLITPLCLGRLKFREDTTGTYQQKVQVTLDSPVMINEIELRLPPHVRAIRLSCATSDGLQRASHRLTKTEWGQQLIIQFPHLINMSWSLGITVKAE